MAIIFFSFYWCNVNFNNVNNIVDDEKMNKIKREARINRISRYIL